MRDLRINNVDSFISAMPPFFEELNQIIKMRK